ncbi:MAG: TlpA family protein disulfide reductase [Planctomycetales bacterium]
MRNDLFRGAGGLAFLAMCCLVASAQTSATGGAEKDSAAPSDAQLNLINGGFATGVLRPSDALGTIRWQSPAFATPFEFAVEEVNSVQFPVPKESPKSTGDYCLELAGGDVLFGAIRGLSGEHLELDESRFGPVHVKRSAIQRIFRWREADDLLYLGPNGLAEWTVSAGGQRGWREEFGQLVADGEGASITRDLKLPAQATIEVELSWKKKPDFVLALGTGSDEKINQQAFRFEVWENDLVIERETEREADVASVQKIDTAENRAHLVCYLDQAQNRCLVFSPQGEQLADLKFNKVRSEVLGGVRLTNKRGDLRLERLRVGRWNGEPPQPIQADKARIHRLDGTILYGQFSGFDPQRQEFLLKTDTGEARVAAKDMSSLFLAPEETDPPPRSIRAVYQDGCQVSGELMRVEEEILRIAAPALRDPLVAPLAQLRSLVGLHQGAPQGSDARLSGNLELQGLKLRGVLRDGQAENGVSCLTWQPLGSRTAGALRPGVSGRIVYREPPPPRPKAPKAPQPAQRKPAGFVEGFVQALGNNPQGAAASGGTRSLHLRTGDTLPCEVTKIDEQGVWFQSTVSDAKFVPHDRVKAVELAPETASVVKLYKHKRDRLLTLPRMQRDSPPTHLIRSRNGDYLRARIAGMDETRLQLEVRLENRELPRERVARIIWLHADELADEPHEAPDAAGSDGVRVQTLRSDGNRLTFIARQVANTAGDADEPVIVGESDILGGCRVPLARIDQLLIGGAIERAAAQLDYQQWKLQNAIDPKFVQAEEDDEGGSAPGGDSPLVGKPAPDFQLELLGGEKFQLSAHKGKIVVLDFWATWCGPCLKSMPQVERVTREFEDQGVELIAVNLEETPKQITPLLERHKLNLTVALDRDGVVAERYAASAIPQTVIIDREGKIVRLYVGANPRLEDQIRETLQSLVSPGDGKADGK